MYGKNTYDDAGKLAAAILWANGLKVVRSAVERNGTAVLRTTAYSPSGDKLFEYPNAEIEYINRDGSPTNGGKVERFTKRNAW